MRDEETGAGQTSRDGPLRLDSISTEDGVHRLDFFIGGQSELDVRRQPTSQEGDLRARRS